MAKRSGRGGSSPEDKQSVSLTSDHLRKMAADLRRLATKLDDRANDMDALKAKPFKVLMGNWENGLRALRGWIAKQLIPKLMAAAFEKNVDIAFELESFDPDSPSTPKKSQ